MRSQLNARGAKTIRGLGRVFRNFDSFDGNKKIDSQEFFSGLREIQVQVTQAEADKLMSILDTNNDGHIDVTEFLVAIRGTLNEKRQAMVDKAFLKFDADGSGVITAADLKGVYNCNFHPKVQSGEMTEDEVFLEFLANFGDKNRDGCVQRDEWNEYYAAVSSSIDNDDHFVQLMKAAW
jgi:Ca2+-binding EF-hand superfamily protein